MKCFLLTKIFVFVFINKKDTASRLWNKRNWWNLNAINYMMLSIVHELITSNNDNDIVDVSYLQCFKSSPDKFPAFFRQLMVMSLREDGLSFKEQTILIVFLIHCFNSHVNFTYSWIFDLNISVWTNQVKVDRSDPVLISLCSSVVQNRSSTEL